MTTIETRASLNLTEWLHRFRCTTCGRVGCWLTDLTAVKRNAAAHEEQHEQQTGATP